ncbi:MAG: UDP-glucose 4-epimerase GalE [Calditrichia bacterium]
MKKILVTGGAGYIGSHAVVQLLENNYEVIVVDNLSNSRLESLDGVEKITGKRPEFVKLDLQDTAATADFFASHTGIAAVIHFAASKAVGESVANPLMYYRNNLQGLINVMEGMLAEDVPALIFSSSATVYGQPDDLPVTEETPILPANSPYGNTKQICEEIIRETVHANEKLNAISLRYFNPVGAHESALIGEFPLGVPNNLLPFITQTGIGLREQLSVFGSDYNTPDGTCIRDYIHVVDLVDAHLVALERLIEGKNEERYEVFNLGTGSGYSVLEVIKAFEKESGVELKYQLVDRREGDVENIYADPALANKKLGWTAKLGLEEMVRSAWKWEKYCRETEAVEQ